MPLLNIKPAQKSNLGFTQRNQATPSFSVQGSTITVSNASNLTYDLLSFDGLGSYTMNFTNCSNIKITNVKFKNITGTESCIRFSSCTNCTVENIYCDDVAGGVYCLNSSNIRIKRVYCTKLQRRTSSSKGQIVQFDKCTNCSASVLRLYNPGGYNSEDAVNEYGCKDCLFYDLVIRTEGTYNGSMTGGLIGDGSSTDVSERNSIEDVISVNAGQAGIAVAGGLNQLARNLKIFGANFTFSNVGLYVARYSNQLDLRNTRLENLYITFTNAAGNPNPYFVDTVEPNASYNTIAVNVTLNVSYVNADMLPAGDDIVNELLFNRLCLAA